MSYMFYLYHNYPHYKNVSTFPTINVDTFISSYKFSLYHWIASLIPFSKSYSGA